MICVALDRIDPYPWFLNKALELKVNDHDVHARITSTEWTDVWRPFLARLHDLWAANPGKRFIIGVGGPPGSGKSVFAEELHYMIDKGVLTRDAHSVALPMDGFHFPNAYLQQHKRKLPDGSEIPLMQVKGQPDTIDVARFRKHIQSLIERPEFVPWPGYSRVLHDVVPDAIKVHKSANVVIIEGNYVLVNRGIFTGIPEMFDLRVYIDAPAGHIIASLVDRHIHGGKTKEEAKDWVKRIDLPNARIAESSKMNADVVLERDADNRVVNMTWK